MLIGQVSGPEDWSSVRAHDEKVHEDDTPGRGSRPDYLIQEEPRWLREPLPDAPGTGAHSREDGLGRKEALGADICP